MSAQILIVGCGAIGGLFAAALSSAARVTALDTNAEHVDAINASGIRIIGRSARTAKIRATADPAALKGAAFDAAIFLIKSKMTADAFVQLRPMLAGKPMLVTLQNGMGNAEVLLSDPQACVIRGVTMNAGRYVEPGCIECLIEGKSWLGPVRGSVEDARPLADLLNEAGMERNLF
jgi:2-dehydropantoate 2-reductase